MAEDFGFGTPPTIDPLGEVDPLTGLRKPPKPLQPQIDDYNKDALVKSLRNTKDWAKGQFSLDEQPNRGPVATVADMGLGLTPGVGQAMAVRDIERARRADDPTGMALATAGIVPWGKAATAGRELIAGQKALKADRGALDIAKGAEQLGEDPWDTAGWFRGRDNAKSWKWEISDQNAKLKEPNLKDHWLEGGEMWHGDLGDTIDHPEAFANYPELANLKTTIKIHPDFPEGGGYNPSTGEIDITAPNRITARRTLLHEMQHGVQDIEPGFEQGTSPDAIYKVLSEERQLAGSAMHPSDEQFAFDQYWKNRGESEARVVTDRADFTPEQARKVSPGRMGVPVDQLLGTSDIVHNILKRLRTP
jgi:hypothetical protein